MPQTPLRWLAISSLIASATMLSRAADADGVGLTPLRREQPALTGAGVPVGQSEGQEAENAWQVSPYAVNLPQSKFIWISALGTATTFPNAVGSESLHADGVGNIFFGLAAGVAPGVQSIRNYDAEYYGTTVLATMSPPERIMNDSWIAGVDTNLDFAFDNFAAQHDTLFVSGMNNAADTPQSPGSSYNGIGVGTSEGVSSIGPTIDDRCKPDIVVAGIDATSFATPWVSGAAALLLQAGARNDGGANTAARATNSLTVKALLLNGAVKQPSWTNSATRPLHLKYGAGNLNMYNSWLQLAGGRVPALASNSVGIGAAHSPTSNSTNAATLRGWDYASISSANNAEGVVHYYFRLPTNGGRFSASATLTWKRPQALAAQLARLRNLDLFLYDTATSNLVASSVSTKDNVEHLFLPNLPPGRYDLQVFKKGGNGESGTENYALAFDFVSSLLSVTRTNGNLVVSWPVSEAGFVLQRTANLAQPVTWGAVASPIGITNGQNIAVIPADNAMSYFRLFRP